MSAIGSPGSTSAAGTGQTLPAAADRVTEVKRILKIHHVSPITWHLTLNNHSSTRPKKYGNRLCRSLQDHKTWKELVPGSASLGYECTVRLPHSFAAGDGIETVAKGEGTTKNLASEDACHTTMAMLLMDSPGEVVLRSKHWNVTPQELLDLIHGVRFLELQPLAEHARPGAHDQGVLGDGMTPGDRDHAVEQIIRRCLESHGGEFDPSKIKHKCVAEYRGEDKMFSQLNRLLHPGQLAAFIDAHPEFTRRSKGSKGMVIMWANAPGPASAATSKWN